MTGPASDETALRRRTDDLLLEVLDGSDPSEVRCEAALALANSGRGSPQVLTALTEALQDPHEAVRRTATIALGRTGDPGAAGPLLGILEGAPELWEEAAAALGDLGHPGVVEPLRELVRSADDHRTRRGAIRALAALSNNPSQFRSESLPPVIVDRQGPHPLL
ncbi:MAG: HEAT repeat domain-containing protein [Actinomycetota bacterium]|nr:HEAT repeat domain-containing protein [Actinomycetota bacterium]